MFRNVLLYSLGEEPSDLDLIHYGRREIKKLVKKLPAGADILLDFGDGTEAQDLPCKKLSLFVLNT